MRNETKSAVAAVTLAFALLCSACSAQPEARKPPLRNPSSEAWYQTATIELTKLAAEAKQDFKRGKLEAASSLIERGETVSARLMAVPRPSLTAMQAASDLDELYGQMLFRNRHYGWARLQFQKNLARWKHFQPTDAGSARLMAVAQSEIEQCDRAMETQESVR
jgi:hypothetical protein